MIIKWIKYKIRHKGITGFEVCAQFAVKARSCTFLAKKLVCVAPYYLMFLFLTFSNPHFPQLIREGFSGLLKNLKGKKKKNGSFFGPWPPDSLGICFAIIWAQAHLISACHALSFRKRRPLFTRLGKTISSPALTGYNSESRREMTTATGFINKA